jgi:hypothetical protein
MSATARPRIMRATAQPPAGVCAADIKTHCGDVHPGEGRVSTCVKEHVSDLSEVCKARLARAAAVARACAPDVKKECASVRRGRGRIEACLKDALANLRDSCKANFVRVAIGRR